MEKMQIVVSDFEKLNAQYPIWSIICLKFKDRSFPSEKWTDATSSILVIWINAILPLIYGAKNEVQLSFLDGDYSIRIKSYNEKEVFISCIDPNHQTVLHAQIGLKYFCRQMLSATSKLAQHFSDHMQSQQVFEVCAAAEKLRAALRVDHTIKGTS